MTMPTAKPGPRNPLPSAIAFIAAVQAVGLAGGLFTASSVNTWYAHLNKPSFNPPNAVFGPVWTLLYLLMALAALRVWRSAAPDGRRLKAILLFALQLVLNLEWSLVFFGLRQPTLALIDLGCLFLGVVATAVCFWRIDRPASLMMAPYAAWVAFAGLLNFEICRLN